LNLLHVALGKAGISQAELASRLGFRKSAVNQVLRGDGNVRISTLADYLHVMGFELELQLVPAGKPREDAVRETHNAWVSKRAQRGSMPENVDFSTLQWHDAFTDEVEAVPR
jgi:transcriptional regulator with XRE-family HTH domain